MSNITLKVNKDVLNVSDKIETVLESIGLAAEGYAKLNCPVDTGALRSSITHTVNGNTVYIGTNKEYAAYVEFGTGKHASGGSGTNKSSWVYKGADGRFHKAFPMKPRAYLKPAIADHVQEYANLAADIFK